MNHIVSFSLLLVCLFSASCTSEEKTEFNDLSSDEISKNDSLEVISEENVDEENTEFVDMATIALQSSESIIASRKALNETIDSIRFVYEGWDVFLGNFEKSQVVWEEYLEAQCLMAYPPSEGGSAFTERFCWNNYRRGLINTRVKVLKEWLRGGFKGDICRCTVKQIVDSSYYPAPGDTSEFYLE